jgi:hypothetical protein
MRLLRCAAEGGAIPEPVKTHRDRELDFRGGASIRVALRLTRSGPHVTDARNAPIAFDTVRTRSNSNARAFERNAARAVKPIAQASTAAQEKIIPEKFPQLRELPKQKRDDLSPAVLRFA